MLYSIKNREDLEKLEKLASLENQVKEVRIQDKLGKQIFHEIIKKVFEPVSDTIKNTSEKLTKTIRETSIINNKALNNLNEKVWEKMNDERMIAPFLASSLVNLFTADNKSQFNLIEDHNSIRMMFLINGDRPVTLYSAM